MTNYITSVGVQTGSIVIAAGATTGTATVSAVGSGAFLINTGNTAQATGTAENDSLVTLSISGTTITATRGATGSSVTATVNYSLIDGDTTNLIKTVQYVSINIVQPASSNTATVSAVTNNNAAIHLLGCSTAQNISTQMNAIVSLSGTTVTATATNALPPGGTLTVKAVVIEFQGTALQSSVQNIAYNAAVNATSATVTVSSITTSRAFLAFGGGGCTTSALPTAGSLYGQLTNSTTVTVNWNTATNQTRRYNACLVEFVAGVLQSAVQRSTIALAAATSNTATITSVTTGNSFLSWLGNSSSASIINPSTCYYRSILTNSTTVTMNVNSSATGTGSFEVIEFVPYSAGGNTFNDNFTDSVTGADSEGAAITVNPTYSDSVAGADSLLAAITFVVSSSDSVTSSDALIGGLLSLNTISDSVTSTDALTLSFVANASTVENIAANDNYDASGGSTNNNSSKGGAYANYPKEKTTKKKKKIIQKENIEQEIVQNKEAIQDKLHIIDIAPKIDYTLINSEINNLEKRLLKLKRDEEDITAILLAL